MISQLLSYLQNCLQNFPPGPIWAEVPHISALEDEVEIVPGG